MQRQHLESDRIAGLQCPGELPVTQRIGLDIGQLGQRAIREPLCLLVTESTRHVPGAGMRTSHKPQCAGKRHRIHRYPETDVLAPGHVVVGLVLVPWGHLACAWLLDQQMVVVQPHGLALHQLRSHMRQGRAGHDLAVRRVVLPGAKVFHKAARVIRLAGHQAQRARMGQVVFDAISQQLHLGWCQHTTQYRGPIAHEGVADRGRQPGTVGNQFFVSHREASPQNAGSKTHAPPEWLCARRPPLK